MSRGATLFACALLVLVTGLAQAQDEPAPPPQPPDVSPPSETAPPPSEKEKPKPPAKDEEPPEKPYLEGWHSGSPPGEHVILRYDMWHPDLDRGAEFEFGKHRPRVGVVTTKELDYPRREVVPGGGVEVYTGKMGWFSFDYWQLDLSGRAFALDAPHVVNHTSFAQGEVVTGETSQHYAKLGDGYDVRYRIPLGDDVSFDIMFAPILLLAIRQESIDVRSLQAFKRGGGEYTSIVLVPGLRLGVDLHLPLKITGSVGSELDWLPELDHSPFSLTDPRITKWEDARFFIGLRIFIVEATIGYRHFKALSEGPTVRTGSARMDGPDLVVALRF